MVSGNTGKKKIVLYNPLAVFYTMPLGLLAIASNLDPEKFDIVIVDSRLENPPLEKMLYECKDALCAGFTVLTGDPIRDALNTSREIKKKFPHLPVVWGGWHPSLFPTETLLEQSIDITVQGQGEVTFKEITEALSAGENLDKIPGMCWRKNGEIIQNSPRNLTEMDDFKFQNYELISVMDYFKLKGQRQFDFISSVGCFFRCTFCADPFVYKRKWSALSPQRIGEEIQYHWNKYKFNELAFQDETFFTYKERVAAISEEFLSRGLKFKWTATMRADQGFRIDEAIIKKAVESGLRWVLIGVESGSNEMLRWLKKDITIEQIMYCAEMCRRLGIAVHFPIIIGFPGETDESVEESLKIAKKLRSMSSRFEIPIFYYKPYPGSGIVKDMQEKGYVLPSGLEEWANFEFNSSAGPWVSKEKYEYIEKFKFYNRFAGGRELLVKKPLKAISKWRLNNNNFNFPIEKYIVEKIKPEPKLS